MLLFHPRSYYPLKAAFMQLSYKSCGLNDSPCDGVLVYCVANRKDFNKELWRTVMARLSLFKRALRFLFLTFATLLLTERPVAVAFPTAKT